MDNQPEIPNRFEKTSKNVTDVFKEVWTLEDWLDIHPFPRFKHGAKYIKDLDL